MGTLAVCLRITENEGRNYNSYFIRFFAFRSSLQSGGKGNSAKNRRRVAAEDSLKQKILELFKNPGEFELPGYDPRAPSLFYAFLEAGNQRSLNLVRQTEMHRIRAFHTLAISRFFPKRCKGFRTIREQEIPAMKHLLKEYYKGYSLYQNDHLNYEGQYYVLEEKGEILAGIQANPTAFRIMKIPGFRGWIFTHILPGIPLLKRLFRKGYFRFVEMEYIYHAPGREDLIMPMIESALAEMNRCATLIWLDAESGLYRYLKHKRKGAMKYVYKNNPVDLMANFSQDGEPEAFRNKPAFVQGIDMV